MQENRVTVVVPTLNGGAALAECLQSLREQTIHDFEVIVIDNSGKRVVEPGAADRVLYNDRNEGFGSALNRGIRGSATPYIASLNDDAKAHPKWLEALLAEIEQRYEIGMCASQVRLRDEQLDSAGMLICRDGSSKQRGRLEPPSSYPKAQEVLLPSASAAIYRRDMLEETGLFDESFFLYCEDTDLGLRARWAAWECRYAPEAVVTHRYSLSAGPASELKAYYVERNRLYLIFKNFPAGCLLAAPFYALARYFWHFWYGMRGQGAAAAFVKEGNRPARLPWIVVRAHAALLSRLPELWRQRRKIKRRLTPKQFLRMLRHYSIGPRQVASL